MRNSYPRRSAPAFTLTELLVVIGILGLLFSFLLPALHRAKTRAGGVLCLNNVRQLGLAWNLYADDEEDRVPGARNWQVAPGAIQPDWTQGNWLNLASPGDASNWDADRYLKQSVLWPYCSGAVAVWRCPADRSTGRTPEGKLVPRIRSFSMNSWVGGPGWDPSGAWQPRDAAGWNVFLKRATMLEPGPARTWVFADERADSINDGYFIVDMAGFPDNAKCRKLVDFPSPNHGGAGALAFADGHAVLQRWTDPRTTPPPLSGQALQQNIDSPDNLDVLWLQERSTR